MSDRVNRSVELARLVDLIEDKLAALDAEVGERPAVGSAEWWKRRRDGHDVLIGELTQDEGARIREKATDTAITLGGIRSSSTSGLIGALRNWQAAARKELKL